MPFAPDEEWQRSTSHPSVSALLAFLEADLDRGMQLVWLAETDWNEHRLVPTALLEEIAQVQFEVQRWIRRADERQISFTALSSRIAQFHAALADLGRYSTEG